MSTAVEIDPRIKSFRRAMDASLEFVRPYWEQYVRLYRLWKGERFPELDATTSKVMVNLFHALVQERLPKLVQNVFASDKFVSLQADSPEEEPFVEQNEALLRDIIVDKANLPATIHPTLQSMLIGGTGYRLATVKWDEDDKPTIGSRALEFFHVLPAPQGGIVNPFDFDSVEATKYLIVIDWWTEDKIRKVGAYSGGDKEGVGKMLNSPAQGEDKAPEEEFRNAYKEVEGVSYGTCIDASHDPLNPGSRRRRVMHWFQRDRHLVIGEDAFVIYDSKPPITHGYFPVVKYAMCPDLDNWFGVPFLGLVEDLIKALIMNFNYRLDHLLGVMFPVTWIRQDIAQGRPKDHLRPRPYQVEYFPQSVPDIARAIFYDRRPDVSKDTFLEDDRIKQMLQKVAGQTETTSSMNDVVGNRTATGVTSILNELSGRPNMESLIVEHTGLRSEATLFLALAAQHMTTQDGKTEFIRSPGAKKGFGWGTIDPEAITDKFTVHTRGTKYMAEQNQSFQKLLAMYPMWLNNPQIDQVELHKQAMSVAEILPDPDRVVLPAQPAPESPMSAQGVDPLTGGGPATPRRPGGAASQQDTRQRSESTANRRTPQPRTSRPVSASTGL